jgi:hypothetical protein
MVLRREGKPMGDGLFKKWAGTNVRGLSYDFAKQAGVLDCAPGGEFSMAGVIGYFKRLDGNVREIAIRSGSTKGATLIRDARGWRIA